MKRIIVIVLVLLLSGCEGMIDEFTPAIKDTQNAESYRVDVTVSNIPVLGSASGYIMKQSNSSVSSIYGFVNYSVEYNDQLVKLTKIGDEYGIITNDIEEDGNLTYIPNDLRNFNSSDFEKNDDGVYTSSKNYGSFIDVEIKIENNYISEFRYKTDMGGVVVSVLLEFSGLNSTRFAVPDYKVFTREEIVKYRLDEAGYTFVETNNGFKLDNWLDDIYYYKDQDSFRVNHWIFDVDFRLTKYNPLTAIEFLSSDLYDEFSWEVYLLIQELYEIVD